MTTILLVGLMAYHYYSI